MCYTFFNNSKYRYLFYRNISIIIFILCFMKSNC
nr:MAG TPA: hypothetical protein [Caudoviricetes sp.]